MGAFARMELSVQSAKQWSLWAGPALAVLVAGLMAAQGLETQVYQVAAVAVICVVWWVFEPVPIPVTSLLPLAAMPLLGVLTGAEVAQAYGSPLILLLLGGFVLSRAMSHSGAHRRLALSMVKLCGGNSDRRLVLGFMLAAAMLSMWISNTATTLMLLPVALAILESLEEGAAAKLAAPLLLGIAYAASVGGLGTPIGTPPNLIFMEVYRQNTGVEISFSTWMSWGLPVVMFMIPAIMFWLTRNLHGSSGIKLPQVGAWRISEQRVMIVFALTALAWITRSEPFGGWSGWLGMDNANDASVALLAVIAMFLIPDGKGEKLLNWEVAATIPWGVLLLFAGGICLSKGFAASGLSALLGGSLASVASLPVWLMMALICVSVTFMTETTSNTASTALLMPILAATALAVDIPLEVMMVPAAMT
ncbi:MAG: sodium-dependent dicarboxylate transporter 2/3/5, partial [Halieaceae bacterium]